MWESIHGLIYGFGFALEPHNLMWCFVGVLLGNLIGVLPGTGPLTAISMLLPLTFAMHPVPAVLLGEPFGGLLRARPALLLGR